jgi:hypothetical protein
VAHSLRFESSSAPLSEPQVSQTAITSFLLLNPNFYIFSVFLEFFLLWFYIFFHNWKNLTGRHWRNKGRKHKPVYTAWSMSGRFWRIMWKYYLWNIISLPSLTTISPLTFQQVSNQAVAIHLSYSLPLEAWLWANKHKRQIFTQHLHFRS